MGSEMCIRDRHAIALRNAAIAINSTSLTVGAVRNTHYCIPSEFEGANLLSSCWAVRVNNMQNVGTVSTYVPTNVEQDVS